MSFLLSKITNKVWAYLALVGLFLGAFLKSKSYIEDSAVAKLRQKQSDENYEAIKRRNQIETTVDEFDVDTIVDKLRESGWTRD